MRQFETQGSVTEPLFSLTCMTESVTVLRVLGIYSMDELNRTDWDKFGKHQARKGPDYVKKYCIIVKSSPGAHKITLGRCKARNGHSSFYFDPVTFAVTDTSTGAQFTDPENSEDDAEDTDEVSSNFCLRYVADTRSPRFIDCWSS